MKTQNLHYVAADLSEIKNTMRINHINDFCLLIEKHHVKEVFVNDKPDNFAIVYQHFMLTMPSKGFKTLEDYRMAEQNCFEEASDYYQAQQLGVKTYENYVLLKTSGVQDPQLIQVMEEKKFLEGFQQITAYLNESKTFISNGC